MTTTAKDMARWMCFFHLDRGALDGVRLLIEESHASLRTRDFDPVDGAPGGPRGFADIPFRPISTYGHIGSINAFLSRFALAPELELGVFIAQNTSDSFTPLARVPDLVFDRELTRRGELTVTDQFPKATDADSEAGVLLSVTTWLGFWRRFRQQSETRRLGTTLSLIALLASLPLVWPGFVVANAPAPDRVDFSEVFSNWPIPLLGDLSLVAIVIAGVAVPMVLCLLPVWTHSGWNLIRRIHNIAL